MERSYRWIPCGCVLVAMVVLGISRSAAGAPFSFSTGDPDGRIGIDSRPPGNLISEIETADDFILSSETRLSGASFTGLVPAGATPGQVVVEIYRVFPNDSDTGRTSGAPTFSTSQVPTRVNSPADNVFASRDSVGGGLTFTTAVANTTFNAANSIQPGGIHAKPDQTTGGGGAVSGQEVRFDVTFPAPIDLPADHYFFIPQVQLSTGNFLWLSAAKPITGGTGAFTPDLQAWTRDSALDPDWLRAGTDIVGGATPPTFNASFALTGETVPEPAVLAPIVMACAAGLIRRRKAL
jgi:hypothetical protein